MPIDPSALDMLRRIQPEDEPDFVDKLVQLYQSSTQSNIELLKTAHQKHNLEELTRAAHTIKSSSANVGAMELMKIAEELECDCRRNNLVYVEHQIESIISEFHRVQTYLNQHPQ